jgi:hypothetical protein
MHSGFTKAKSYGSVVPVVAPEHCFHMWAPIRAWIFNFFINAELDKINVKRRPHSKRNIHRYSQRIAIFGGSLKFSQY